MSYQEHRQRFVGWGVCCVDYALERSGPQAGSFGVTDR